MSQHQADQAARDMAARTAVLNVMLEAGASLEDAATEAGYSLRAVKRWLAEGDERIGAKARAKLTGAEELAPVIKPSKKK